MGSINKSHNKGDGGILLFGGELILLYCDSVSCEVSGSSSFKGRVYLTTHRLVVIMAPYREDAPVRSFCAPFCAITKCSVEQPVFGANYIEATVRDEADPNKSFSFKLKFSKGGAIELAMAMNRAVQAVGRSYNPSMQPPPPAYTPSPNSQFYQAPANVYAPGYNTGFQMPVQQFPDAPPIGFVYASEAPPPYPGLGGNVPQGQQQQQQPSGQYPYGGGYSQAGPGYPGASSASYPTGYPTGYPTSYPGQQPGWGQPQEPPPSYPGHQHQQQPAGYPGQQQQQQPGSGYPGQQAPPPATQQPPAGYPQQPPPPAAGGQPPSSSGYPDLSQAVGGGPSQPQPQQQQHQQQQQPNQSAWPSAPSFNPNWSDDKKNQ